MKNSILKVQIYSVQILSALFDGTMVLHELLDILESCRCRRLSSVVCEGGCSIVTPNFRLEWLPKNKKEPDLRLHAARSTLLCCSGSLLQGVRENPHSLRQASRPSKRRQTAISSMRNTHVMLRN